MERKFLELLKKNIAKRKVCGTFARRCSRKERKRGESGRNKDKGRRSIDAGR